MSVSALLIAFLIQSSLVIVAGLVCARGVTWNAAARHSILIATLMSVVMLPALCAISSYYGLSRSFGTATRAAEGIPSLNSFPRSGSQTTDPRIVERASDENSEPTGIFVIAPEARIQAESTETESFPARSPQDIHKWLLIAPLLLYAVGGVVLLRRLAGSIHLVNQIRVSAIPVSDSTVNVLFADVCRSMGLSKIPLLLASELVDSPAAHGIRRPAVLLPATMLRTLTADELRGVFVHEVAHIRRQDSALAILQKCVGIVFWPHPLVYALNRAISTAREEICDNHVLQSCDAIEYGRMLLAMSERTQPAFSLGLLTGGESLEDRILKLTSTRRKPMVKTSLLLKSGVGIVALALTIAISLGTPSWSQDVVAQRDSGPEARVVIAGTDEVLTIDDDGVQRKKVQRHDTNSPPPTEWSPTNKVSKEARSLKKQYDKLQRQQEQLSKQIAKVEDQIRNLGFAVPRSAVDHIIYEKGQGLRSAENPYEYQLPTAPRRPELPQLPAQPAQPEIAHAEERLAPQGIEARLKKLEEMIEALVEERDSNPGVRRAR